jgi:hypothetical protein
LAFALFGCSAAGGDKPVAAVRAEPDWSSMSAAELLEARRPAYPLTLYSAYPAAIRPLLQRYDLEDELCRDGTWTGGQHLPACNRRHFVHVALDRRGWCFSRPSGQSHSTWILCGNDGHYRPGYIEAVGPPESAFRLAWADDQYRRARGQAGSPDLPAQLRLLWRAAEQGLAAPIDDADRQRFPVARYQRYPAALRPLLQRFEVEDRNCRVGSVAGGAEGLRACNRQVFALIELERRGWCVSMKSGWRRCRDDPDYRLGDAVASSHLNSETLIRWTDERERGGTVERDRLAQAARAP